MGARVAGGGGIVPGGSLATVVGSCTGVGGGAKVGAARDVWTADVLTVAGSTGTGCAVVVGGTADIAVDTGVDPAVDGGV